MLEELREDSLKSLEIDNNIREILMNLIYTSKDIRTNHLVFQDPRNEKIKYLLLRDGLTWILIRGTILANDLVKIREDIYLFDYNEPENNFRFLLSQFCEEVDREMF
ncbi:hypothetical protein [Desulfosporosinus sp. FKB]|uniref:hypothetical protein n=1 Tax=Desulfosporosinus sp. FKB TaxID=1969835 RepID=UPI000B49B283|nr:hypothetical protein [Desulfosporosinus sp. FKB]